MEWREYSLPHKIIEKYKHNNDLSVNKFSGDYYLLQGLSNQNGIAEATWIASLILATPFFLVHWVAALVMVGVILLSLAIIISLIDTYCTRKYRVRINMKKSLDYIFSKKKRTRRGMY